MTENLDSATPQAIAGDNRPVFTVSEISQALKRAVEENFANVRVKGEITSLKKAGSSNPGANGGFMRDADGNVDGSRSTSVTGRNGNSYSGSTTLDNGVLTHSHSCTNAAGDVVSCRN